MIQNVFFKSYLGLNHLALSDRLLDSNEVIQKQVIGAICEVAVYVPKSIPAEAIIKVEDVFRD